MFLKGEQMENQQPILEPNKQSRYEKIVSSIVEIAVETLTAKLEQEMAEIRKITTAQNEKMDNHVKDVDGRMQDLLNKVSGVTGFLKGHVSASHDLKKTVSEAIAKYMATQDDLSKSLKTKEELA